MNIIKKLGYITTTEYLEKEKEYKDKISDLELKIFKLERLTQKDISLIDVDLSDPTPLKTEARRAYVAHVAGFFFDILEKKLKFMLSNVHTLMEDSENDERRKNQLVGAAYSLRELLFWGRNMTNEHISYLNKEAELSEEEVQELKDIIK